MNHGDSTESQLATISERLNNLSAEHGRFREEMGNEMHQLRDQTHDWLQIMVNKLPTWAVVLGGFMATALGSMAMWILTHRP